MVLMKLCCVFVFLAILFVCASSHFVDIIAPCKIMKPLRKLFGTKSVITLEAQISRHKFLYDESERPRRQKRDNSPSRGNYFDNNTYQHYTNIQAGHLVVLYGFRFRITQHDMNAVRQINLFRNKFHFTLYDGRTKQTVNREWAAYSWHRQATLYAKEKKGPLHMQIKFINEDERMIMSHFSTEYLTHSVEEMYNKHELYAVLFKPMIYLGPKVGIYYEVYMAVMPHPRRKSQRAVIETLNSFINGSQTDFIKRPIYQEDFAHVPTNFYALANNFDRRIYSSQDINFCTALKNIVSIEGHNMIGMNFVYAAKLLIKNPNLLWNPPLSENPKFGSAVDEGEFGNPKLPLKNPNSKMKNLFNKYFEEFRHRIAEKKLIGTADNYDLYRNAKAAFLDIMKKNFKEYREAISDDRKFVPSHMNFDAKYRKIARVADDGDTADMVDLLPFRNGTVYQPKPKIVCIKTEFEQCR